MSFVLATYLPVFHTNTTTLQAAKVSEQLTRSTPLSAHNESENSEEEYRKLDYMYSGHTIYAADSYDLVAGAGLINERIGALLAQIDAGVPLQESPEIEEKMRKIAASLSERQNENIYTWAQNISNDIANCTD